MMQQIKTGPSNSFNVVRQKRHYANNDRAYFISSHHFVFRRIVNKSSSHLTLYILQSLLRRSQIITASLL